MDFLFEFKNYYSPGDIVIIEYWYNGMLTPVKILEKTSSRKYLVSHNIEWSKISGAPDEYISSSDIIDNFSKSKS